MLPRRAPSQVTVYETVIELENITTTQNVSVLVNETIRYNATVNISYDVLRNISYDVSFNQTFNVTFNTTVNVTEFVNVTKNITTTYNISSHQPVDVVLALDASRSVKDADFVAENRAGRELLRGLRDSLTGDLHAGVAVWAVDGVSRRDLTPIANATEIEEMEDVARLPYCAAVPPPYSADAETYSNHFCVGDPPAVQDEDHAYDLRHDASQVWGLTTGTYYAQALLRCHDALIPQNDAFRLCVVVTDGQIDEDRYAQCDDDVRRPTMTYTANMTGDYYDAGTEIFKDDNGACGWHAAVRWVAPGAYAFCVEHDIMECTVDAIAATLKANGIKVLSVLVSENNDLEPALPRRSFVGRVSRRFLSRFQRERPAAPSRRRHVNVTSRPRRRGGRRGVLLCPSQFCLNISTARPSGGDAIPGAGADHRRKSRGTSWSGRLAATPRQNYHTSPKNRLVCPYAKLSA